MFGIAITKRGKLQKLNKMTESYLKKVMVINRLAQELTLDKQELLKLMSECKQLGLPIDNIQIPRVQIG